MATKDQLLSYLKASKGSWISGERLSSKIVVSRSAIWKHIRKLREEGYLIDSSPKKGYLLRKTSDLLLPDEIRDGLDTQVFGQEDIVFLRETESTNRTAKDLAARGASEGTLVISEKQTKGRGRRGRNWFSPSQKGIYISLILKPNIPPAEAPRITILAAVAIAEALLSLTSLKISIKWPNDILVNGKKVAGILTEMSTEIDVINYVVVGLGLNVNTTSFPDDIKAEATSVLIETGEYFPRVRILREYLRQYEKHYATFQRVGFEPVIERWKELADIIGRQIIVDVLGNTYIGKVKDINEDGVLILEDSKGISHRIFSGDLTLV